MSGSTELFRYVAFYDDERQQPIQAFAPRRAESREHAIRAAQVLAQSYAGAAAWRCDVAGDGSESGVLQVLFSSGRVGDLA